MSGTGRQDDRDEGRSLRDDLRSLDPASSLPPADLAGVARLLEDTMGDPMTDGSSTDESRADGTHDRSRLTWLVAAAAVAVIALGSAFVLVQRGGDDVTVAGGDPTPSAPASAGAASVTELSYTGAGPGRCVAPVDPDILAGQTTAFDGVVQSVSGGIVTLEPSKFYAGETTDLVTVRAPSQQVQAMLSEVDFVEGQRYLVSATDGALTLCGMTAPYSDDLAATFAEAFAG